SDFAARATIDATRQAARISTRGFVLQLILRVLIGLSGLLFIGLAIGFLIDPARAASNLGVGALTPVGLATLRGDFLGFFGAGGLLTLIGAVRCDVRFLTAPLLMIALTLIGRLITVASIGFYPAMGLPMAIEAAMTVLLVLGWRGFPESKV